MPDVLKHPSKAFLAFIVILLIGVIAGITVLIGMNHNGPVPSTPDQKLQQDGYTQAPGISNGSQSDIGLNGNGRAEWASQGCQGEAGFKSAVSDLGYTGKVSVNCSQGFLVVDADTARDLLSFASALGTP